MMSRSFGSPGRYIQRKGEIDRLMEHLVHLGRKPFVLIDGFVYDKFQPRIAAALDDRFEARFERFSGECSRREIARVEALVKEVGSDIVVGVGGGKTIDTAKMASFNNDARLCVVPTIASTDAPTSAVAVIYTDDGVFERAHNLPRNPDAVIVDPQVIVEAPTRFLMAGIGDALSTWYEARANLEAGTMNYIAGGFPATEAGLAIARHCHDVILREAHKAKISAEAGLVTNAVEDIIEANTLLSGLGFENCGVSVAHGVHDALTVLEEVHGYLHGEKVTFGIICLMALEAYSLDEIVRTVKFCRSLGLPTCLADLNVGGDLHEKATRIAQEALKGEIVHSTKVKLDVPVLRDAILLADRIGKPAA